MISTTYTVSGLTSAADVRAVRAKVSEVEGIGAVAVELVSGGESSLIIKHKDDVEPDHSAIEQAVRTAGDYTLAAGG